MSDQTNETNEQLTLTPEKPPVVVDERIPVDELPEILVGPEPDAALLRSIKRYGILDPVLVIETPSSGSGTHYRIADGRRRVKAARKLGIEKVPARIVDDAEIPWMGNVITIASHATRKANPMSEYEAIKTLVDAGHSESEIQQATGLAIPTIRQRMQFGGLTPILRKAVSSGEIKSSVALRAAKLSKKQQTALGRVLRKNGKLTGKDVEEVRRVKVDAARAALPFETLAPDLPDEPQSPEKDQPEPQKVITIAGLRVACERLFRVVEQGADENTLIGRVMDLEKAYRQARAEGFLAEDLAREDESDV